MKLLHTSDWHLGRMIFGRSLLSDQEYFIQQIFLPTVRTERPDCILLSGDIFDRQIAPVEAIRLFDSVVSELHKMGIPLLAVSGNHDGADRIAIGTELLRTCGINIATKIEDAFSPVRITTKSESADIYLLPYYEPAAVKQFLKNENLHGFNDTYGALLDEIRKTFQPNVLHILLAHCFVAGSQISDSESPIYVGGSGEINSENFHDFDYVALGHLHAPQKAGKNGRYSGSPLKYSFDEERQRKSLTIIDFKETKQERSEILIHPLRDMKTIKGTMEQLLNDGKQHPQENYVFLHITDNAPVYMPADQLRPYYPNMLAINCDWLNASSSNETDHSLREQLLHRKADELSIFSHFLTQICGTEMDEKDKALFLQAFQQTKGEDEV